MLEMFQRLDQSGRDAGFQRHVGLQCICADAPAEPLPAPLGGRINDCLAHVSHYSELDVSASMNSSEQGARPQ